MTAIDPRELSDRELFAHILFGDLARPGWSGRGRQLARRALLVALMTLAAIVVLIGLGLLVAFAIAWLG